jgi:hypothetical protein
MRRTRTCRGTRRFGQHGHDLNAGHIRYPSACANVAQFVKELGWHMSPATGENGVV